jgi:type I restriction enzyme M protein
VDKDLVETVILLPENMFYNANAPGIILVINKNKRKPDEILLINASNLFEKGRPKNFLPKSIIEKISELYLGWKEEEAISKVVAKEEAVKNDYNLSPSRYIAQNGEDDTFPLEDAVVQLKEAEEERREADEKLKDVLSQLGITL